MEKKIKNRRKKVGVSRVSDKRLTAGEGGGREWGRGGGRRKTKGGKKEDNYKKKVTSPCAVPT